MDQRKSVYEIWIEENLGYIKMNKKLRWYEIWNKVRNGLHELFITKLEREMTWEMDEMMREVHGLCLKWKDGIRRKWNTSSHFLMGSTMAFCDVAFCNSNVIMKQNVCKHTFNSSNQFLQSILPIISSNQFFQIIPLINSSNQFLKEVSSELSCSRITQLACSVQLCSLQDYIATIARKTFTSNA